MADIARDDHPLRAVAPGPVITERDLEPSALPSSAAFGRSPAAGTRPGETVAGKITWSGADRQVAGVGTQAVFGTARIAKCRYGPAPAGV